ncbi:MAG: helix-turn-helix transcriptional regulator [Micrococcus sp.]|nr:helix-turn-helix transcriptional regulator [Micrococcus sp.]
MIPQWTLGDRLRKAREMTGLSQAQFAKRIEVSVGTIGNYEAGRRAPRAIVIRAWALATGVPRPWLETGEAPSPSGDGASSECTPRDLNPEPAD